MHDDNNDNDNKLRKDSLCPSTASLVLLQLKVIGDGDSQKEAVSETWCQQDKKLCKVPSEVFYAVIEAIKSYDVRILY